MIMVMLMFLLSYSMAKEKKKNTYGIYHCTRPGCTDTQMCDGPLQECLVLP